MVVMSFIACAHVILRRLYDHRQPPADGGSWLHRTLSFFGTLFSMHRSIGCAMSILLFCYTAIAVAVVQPLHCVDVAPGVRRLFSAPTVDCDSTAYHQFLPLAFIWLTVYVIGFPLAILVFLRLHRSHLHTSALPFSPSSAAVLTSSLNDFDARWGSFYLQYTNRAWFWQPLVLLRRFFFALTSVLLVHDDRTRLALFTFLNFISLLLHQWTRPFEDEKLNSAESVSYTLLVCMSVLLSSATSSYSIAVQVVLFLLIVPFGALMVVWAVRSQWMQLRGKLFSYSAGAAHDDDHPHAQDDPTNDDVPSSSGQAYGLNEVPHTLPTTPTLHRPLLAPDQPRT
jgi:hypothetical protein